MSAEFVLYLDESGTHAMDYAGRPAPPTREIFLLCGCLFRRRDVPRVTAHLDELKRRYLERTDIVIVSRRIRKREKGFEFLNDPALRERFLADVSTLIRELPFRAFSAVVDKYRLWQQDGEHAAHPYNLSLALVMDGVCAHVGRQGAKVEVIAESRGRREDAELRLEFDRLMREGTAYTSAAELRRVFIVPIDFKPKRENIAGHQIADLVAYPANQRLTYPQSRHASFDVVMQKLDRTRQGGVWGAGLKVFPDADPEEYGL